MGSSEKSPFIVSWKVFSFVNQSQHRRKHSYMHAHLPIWIHIHTPSLCVSPRDWDSTNTYTHLRAPPRDWYQAGRSWNWRSYQRCFAAWNKFKKIWAPMLIEDLMSLGRQVTRQVTKPAELLRSVHIVSCNSCTCATIILNLQNPTN